MEFRRVLFLSHQPEQQQQHESHAHAAYCPTLQLSSSAPANRQFHDQDRGAKVKASELICDPIHPPMAPQHRQAEQRQSRTDISAPGKAFGTPRSEEHTSELQSLMRISYAVFCLKKQNKKQTK